MLAKLIKYKEYFEAALHKAVRADLDRIFYDAKTGKFFQDYIKELRQEEKDLEFYIMLGKITGRPLTEETRYLYEEAVVLEILEKHGIADAFDKLFIRRYKGYCWIRSQAIHPEPFEKILADLVRHYRENNNADNLLKAGRVLKLLEGKSVNAAIKTTKRELTARKRTLINVFSARCQREKIKLPESIFGSGQLAENEEPSETMLEFLQTLIRIYDEKDSLLLINPRGRQTLINRAILYENSWPTERLLEAFPVLKTPAAAFFAQYKINFYKHNIRPDSPIFELLFERISPTHAVPRLNTGNLENILLRRFDKEMRKNLIELLHDMQNMRRAELERRGARRIKTLHEALNYFLPKILSEKLTALLRAGEKYQEWLQDAPEYADRLQQWLSAENLSDKLRNYWEAINLRDIYYYYFHYPDTNAVLPWDEQLMSALVQESLARPQTPENIRTVYDTYKFNNKNANMLFALYVFFSNPAGFAEYQALLTAKRNNAAAPPATPRP
jgi:FMN phosphatase YigB (HAD superfamily)